MHYGPQDDDSDTRRTGPGLGGPVEPAPDKRHRSPGLAVIVGGGLALAVVAGLVVTLVVVLNDKGAAAPAGSPSQSAAAASPTGPAAPELLALGKAHDLIDAAGTVTATAFRYRVLRSAFPPDRKGYQFAGAEVKVCLTKVNRPDDKGGVSWEPWSLTFADSTVITPVSSWSDDWFTVPLYPPVGKVVRQGDCVRGWVLYEVPKGKKPAKVVYSPGDNAPLEWKVS